MEDESPTQIDKILLALEGLLGGHEFTSEPKPKGAVMDLASICCVEGKTAFAKYLLGFFDAPEREKPFNLNYDTGSLVGCKVSVNYLSRAMKLIEVSSTDDDSVVTLKVKFEYPVTLENKQFRIIIAPMIEVETDEEREERIKKENESP
jgi:hypothetical protein